jgi:hypothetical protein
MTSQIPRFPGGPLRFKDTIYEILPNLFLASYHHASEAFQNGRLPKDVFVVNCTKDYPMLSTNNIRVSVNDDGNTNTMQCMTEELPGVCRKIHEELQHGNIVLVHCLAGQQRSPTVIAAYLMMFHDLSLEHAITHVRQRKPDAFFWKVNFMETLQQIASQYTPQ